MAPYSNDQVSRAFRESADKETRILESTARDAELNFGPFFGAYDVPIHFTFDPNPEGAREMHMAIESWIRDLEQTDMLYPKISRKSVSRTTCEDFMRLYPDQSWREWSGVSQEDLELAYHMTGEYVSGCCEMRQTWYTASLSPDTYFAPGGHEYQRSKYLARPFSELCDKIAYTHRHDCMDPTRLDIPEGYHALLYDLTAFTSNCHEHRNFLHYLGIYCHGRKVRVMDTFHGVLEQDLGQMILDYNTLNTLPIYHSDRVYQEKSRLDLVHHVAGFHGVYGNKDTAKFLHGAVMRQVVQSQSQLNVAGDDGAIATKDDEKTIRQIRTLGELAMQKVFTTEDVHAIHLRRPIIQIGNRLVSDEMFTWPSFEYSMDDSTIDSRFTDIQRMSKNERRSALGRQVKGFLQSIRSTSHEFAEYHSLIWHYLSHLYAVHGLPKEGHVPQCCGKLSLGLIPRLDNYSFHDDILHHTLRYHYHDIILIPYRGYVKKPLTWEESMSYFECNSDKHLQMLELLEYLQSEKLTAVYTSEEGWGKLVQEYENPEPRVIAYSVVKTIPSWIQVYALTTRVQVTLCPLLLPDESSITGEVSKLRQ